MNVHCSLRRGKNDPEKVFQGSPQGCYSHHRPRSKAGSCLVLKGRAASPDREGQDEPAQCLRGRLSWSHVGGSLQRPKGSGCPAETRVILSPQWAWKTEYWVQEDCSGALISNGICLASFGLAGTHHPLLPSDFSFLEWDSLSHACPPLYSGSI